MINICTEKSRLKTTYDVNTKKIINNVANNGAKIGDCAIMSRNGEYYGFSVKFLEIVHPLLTELRINNALNYYKNGQIEDTLRTLCIYDEYIKSNKNKNIIDFVFYQWLTKADIDLKQNNLEFIKNINPDEFSHDILELLMNRIHTVRSSPIIGKIEIIALGKSTGGNTVVPESWLGKVFGSGKELHSEMDKLEWRVNSGRPPVSFCCIYTMKLLNGIQWMTNNTLKTKKIKNNMFVSFDNERGHISKKITYDDNNQYLILEKQNIVISVNKKYLRTEKKQKIKYSIGHLSSLLQKCFRVGLGTNKLLRDTIIKFSNAKSYNLPDINFAKVSGWRQLFWRLYISIIEDVTPYKCTNKIFNLIDIAVLSIISHYDPDIDFGDIILNKTVDTAMAIINHCHNDELLVWDWRDGTANEIDNDNIYNYSDENLQSMLLVAQNNLMPMMNNDKYMMLKSINYYKTTYIHNVPHFNINKESFLVYDDENLSYDALLSSHDMHCSPNILIICNQILSAKMTMKQVGNFIWNTSSKINLKEPPKKIKLLKLSETENKISKIIKQVQHNYFYNNIYFDPHTLNLSNYITNTKTTQNKNVPLSILRDIFLLLFGKNVRLSGYDVTVTGNILNPLKIKKRASINTYIDTTHKDYDKQKEKFIEKMTNVKIKTPVINLKNSEIKIRWDKKIINKSQINLNVTIDKNNKFNFYVNDIKLTDVFNPSNIIEVVNDKIKIVNTCDITDTAYINILKNTMTDDNCDYMLIKTLGIIHRHKVKTKNNIVIDDWDTLCSFSELHNSIIWKQLYTRIIMRTNNVIYVGPVDRAGNKMQNSISHNYEGVIWRLLHLLSVLYPRCIHQNNNENDSMNFRCNNDVPEYDHMMKIICKLIYGKKTARDQKINKSPKITTNLWNHQKETVCRLVSGYKNDNKKGFGDASHVGAGKTLTALSTMVQLCDNKQNEHSGFLVLVPTSQLLNTWSDEIKKHTSGFNIIIYNNVSYSTCYPIHKNTIILSTLGRMRDHPILKTHEKKWSLVVIDECLSVQNREALQTEEAWRQVINSYYGVLMMSATFFRSRFDKLFYMLKMLQSNLPENDSEYLDCILNEHMICNITENDRIWKTNINRIKMDESVKIKYDLIKKEDLSNEQKYIKLQKLIFDEVNYVDIFYNLIVKLLGENKKILVYGNSKNEAECIYNKNTELIGRYPDISKNVTAVALSEATYGLNDLVKYDTILIRPPMPDLLPQIKGRLDRAGQNNKMLNMEYVILDDCSVEEATLFRLDVANNFYNNYIMPIADFYKIAVN